MPLTSPDSIPYPAVGDTVAPLNETIQGVAVATQAALSKRQQGSYVVPDYNALLAVTGMKQSDYGYVLGTKTPYLFDGGTWRLATPHMEFTASKAGMANSNVLPVGVFTPDASASSSTTIASAGTDGIIRITDPGIYAISTVTTMRNSTDTASQAATGRTFLDMSFVLNAGDIQRMSIVVGEDRGSLAAPNVRVTAPDTPIYIQLYRIVADTSGKVNTRVRVTRIA